MSEFVTEEAVYGNWVSSKFVFVPGVLGLLFVGLSLLLPVLGILAVIFLLCALYFAYARYLFSDGGGDIQTKIQDLVLDHISGWDGVGKVLDIGCGTGMPGIRVCGMHFLIATDRCAIFCSGSTTCAIIFKRFYFPRMNTNSNRGGSGNRKKSVRTF